jgi:DNA-binding SARP family transcriptional activator/Flp pilus assembly protein TadD
MRGGADILEKSGTEVLTVGLLGPLEVSVDGRSVELTTGRLRTLLAVLAMSAGQAVSVDRLAAAMWEGELPADARRAVQTYVTRLRGVLGPELIATSPAGYVLRAEPEQVDALRFLRLLDAAAGTAEVSAEEGLLAEALRLWRGTPFAGVESGWLQDAQAPRLVERYLAGVERRVDLDLAAGRHGELVAELRGLTARYPLRESLWVRLLVVLDRCGRQAEALERYGMVRVRLTEELGVDPGPDLQRVYADLLAGRPPEVTEGPAPAAPQRLVPRQLPVSGDGFTGRDAALTALGELFGEEDGPSWRTAMICVISGMAGVGKTALAIHWAHRLAERFPDGQLYVDLHGATAGLHPLQPLEVLGRFLRALGTDPTAIPTTLEEASAAFRSRVADRRVLVVLDNAADAAQVVPLLPASPGSRVLVTSRQALVSLDGAAHLQLDVLEPDEAVELLGRLAGPERVAAEPEAAAEVAAACGWLPLALRIAGARLAARPTWPVRALAERLGDAQRRLDELEIAETGVRASFAVSWRQLSSGSDAADRSLAAAFALLGVLDGPEMSVPVAARLLDQPEDAAERALERLVDAQLLETPSPGRYQLHDLVRLYVRELACRHHDESARAAALTRALGFYTATAWQTLPLLRPGDYRMTRMDDRWAKGGLELADEQSALRWLEAERPNLLAAVRQAAATPGVPPEIALQLAQALFGFFSVRCHWQDWVQVDQIALGVARRIGDRAAQAQAHNDLGYAYWLQGRFEEAVACHQQSLVICRELSDRYGEGLSLSCLGQVYRVLGRHDQAQAAHLESLAIFREVSDRHGQATSLGGLGVAYQRQGRYEEALTCLRESLAIRRELGDRRSQAISLGNLGLALEGHGRYAEASACHQQSLAIHRELGDRHGQATSLADLGVVYQRQGNHQQALACQRESLEGFRKLGDPHCQAESLRELGVTLRALGRCEEARAHWLEALAIFEQLRTSHADGVRALLAEEPMLQRG